MGLSEWQLGKPHHCKGFILGNTSCKISSAPENYAEEELQSVKLGLFIVVTQTEK